MNFQRCKFSKSGLKTELGISDLAIKSLTYWNTKDIKPHQLKRTKIIKRLDEVIILGEKILPEYFCFSKIKDGIDLYEKHIHLNYSKLFKRAYSIDEFFQFSEFSLIQIKQDKKLSDYLKETKSIFCDLLKNEKKFFYEGKRAEEDFELMIKSILASCSGTFDSEDSLRIAGLKIQSCYNDNIKNLVLCDGLVTDYEIKNKERFQNKECFFNWVMRYFIQEKGLQQGRFQVKYLCSNFLWRDFINFMKENGR